MKIKNVDELQDVLEDFGGETICVRTRVNDLYLVNANENGDAFYVGVPIAEDEYAAKVDQNRGMVEALPPLSWPLTLVNRYGPDQKRWRERRISFAADRMLASETHVSEEER